MNSIKFLLLLLICTLTVHAQLVVLVSPVKIVGQKAVATLEMTNNLAQSVKSARAICFLVDERGKMIGQSSKWVIGGIKDRPALLPNSGTTFNFVITSPQPFISTNLTARVTFNRLVLDGGNLADVSKNVIMTQGVKK
jgi:hypothetical protein